MWVQQNKDQHGCNDGTNITAVGKVSNKIKKHFITKLT